MRRLLGAIAVVLVVGVSCRAFDDNAGKGGGGGTATNAGDGNAAGSGSEQGGAGAAPIPDGGKGGARSEGTAGVFEGGASGSAPTGESGSTAQAGMPTASGGQPAASASGGAGGDPAVGGGGSDGEPTSRILGAPAPGTPLDPEDSETYALGYFASSQGAGLLCPKQPGIAYCNTFGAAGSRPYVLSSPAACGTHAQPTEFAGFGVAWDEKWYTSPADFYWTWGLDEKYNGTQGVHPWPAAWNGVSVSFELEDDGGTPHAIFTVDWDRHFWRSQDGVVEIEFTPETLTTKEPAYPVIGRWRRDYGERLGLYQAGKFYLDWDGDNAWDSASDRVLQFAAPGVYPVAADFWPGGGDEVALYKDGNWYIDMSQNGAWDGVAGTDVLVQFGSAGSLPVVARDGWTRDCE